MQNLIVLCQCCFSWVEPHSEMCPECGAEVILERPDLDQQALTDVLGNPLMVLGPVRVERRGLPSYGFVIGTTSGLLFLPRLNRRLNGAWEAVSSQHLPGWWPFGGDLTSPRFLNWLRRPFTVASENQDQPAAVPEKETSSLADRLMESPGGFFVERRLVRTISGRRRTVNLERSPLRTLTLIDETKEGTLRASLNGLFVQSTWDDSRAAI